MVGTHAYYLGNISESKIQDGRHYIQNYIVWLIGMTRTCSWCLVVGFWGQEIHLWELEMS